MFIKDPMVYLGIGDAVSTETAGVVTAGGKVGTGMGNEVGQTILVHMNILKQAHIQSQ